jgi:pullulanase
MIMKKNIKAIICLVNIFILSGLFISACVFSQASPNTVTLVGNLQSELGCPGDWQPPCSTTFLAKNATEWSGAFNIPAGNWEFKIAINGSWAENYGAGAQRDGPNITLNLTEARVVTFVYDEISHRISNDAEPIGNLRKAKAYWLSRDTIAIDTVSLGISVDDLSSLVVKLHHSASADLTLSSVGVAGGEFISLSYDANGLSDTLKNQFRHLKNLTAFKINISDINKTREILKQQIALSITGSSGNLIEATGLQFAGVLDDLFFYSGDLGPLYKGAIPTVKLWAPTARSVKLLVFNTPDTQTIPQVHAMNLDAASGVWNSVSNARWNRKYYLYEIDVFVRKTGKIETLRVTDPYSVNTSVNGKLSQFVNLNDADLKPQGWDRLIKPVFTVPEDIAIYELHVRDFSISDKSVPEHLRGTFAAFTEKKSLGMRHLKRLASAGLSHVHLLPVFDCATVNENKQQQKTISEDLSVYAPDGEEQQAAVNAIRSEDGFNWCYDPHHYTVPDGSYATDPNGTARIREFRRMVQALNRSGLRVIMDVVYNHTSGSGLVDTSVLDKVVPNYYHRLNREGDIERSTCCENTASENKMMEKLMKDSIKTWAKAYKVDGFRYDIMGHHTKDNIVNIKNDIQSLSLAKDGINGKHIYFYGEGWNFGEVLNDSQFIQARIGNMSGTGVGTFNNFIRDAVRGGGPFDSGIDHVKSQSFINGLYTDPNEENTASAGARDYLLKQTDILKVALVGSLKDYRLVDAAGTEKLAAEIEGAGYTLDPQETINYIEAHDNETLFDMLQYKAALTTSMEDKVRMQNLGNALLIFSQGIPFIHAGQDMLRSKSMDRNTYDAGDWFNLLDFSYQKNGWGRGLPLRSENERNWSVAKPRLADPRLVPTEKHIRYAQENTRRLLKIRQSSRLFRLQTAEQIKQQVSFFNNGPDQIPGVIAMHIEDSKANVDPVNEQILVIFNANPESKTLTIPQLKMADFKLHPAYCDFFDKRVSESVFNNRTGEFSVSGRTAVVFVSRKK